MPDRDSLARDWSASDTACATAPVDRAIVEDIAAVRTLIIDLLLAGDRGDELYEACAVLGRLIAQRSGSPTLASGTVDHVARALGAGGEPWVGPARAAVAEAFVAAVTDQTQGEALRAWEFPACTVPLGDATIAIAAGFPSADGEALSAWAARVAKAAALEGVRRAVIAGTDGACAALADTLGLVGIEVERRPRGAG